MTFIVLVLAEKENPFFCVDMQVSELPLLVSWLYLIEWKSLSYAWLFATPWTARVLCPGNSPGQNTGVGSRSLLQRLFLTQRSNPGLLHCRQIFHHLSYLLLINFLYKSKVVLGFPRSTSGKELACQGRRQKRSLSREDLSGESHGQRSP